MAKTCIVCGGVAGSGEHVFPAALGGRRTNSGIYCPEHDNGYSGLVNEIAGQLDFLNAYLGVYPDRSRQPKTAYAEHTLTGETISISAKEIRFTKPRLISRNSVGECEELLLSFPNHQSVRKFIKEMEANGYAMNLQSKPSKHLYITGAVRHQRVFGGGCGLGAIAYITQTFFAQEFAELARTGALSNFITYTQAIAKVAALGGCEKKSEEPEEVSKARTALAASLAPFDGEAPVWWDFSPSPDARPNKFEFGHRVTVGVDGSDGQIYGRVALFSTLNFALRLGSAPQGAPTREVTVDIDPLARHPPHDIAKREEFSVPSRVRIPKSAIEGLAAALANGTQERSFTKLLERLTEYQLINLSRAIHVALTPCSTMSKVEARALIEKVLDEHSQQIWRAVTFVAQGLKDKMIEENLGAIVPVFDTMIAHEAQSASGLSQQAEVTLALAKAALATQMEEDFAAGVLDRERIAELMGRGAGLHIVGQAMLSPVLHVFGSLR